MFEIDILSLIPDNLKISVRDKIVDFVADQAKKYSNDEVADKIKLLRSDATFNKHFEGGLGRAIKRFVQEYEQQDEDLVAAIASAPDFFKSEAVQKNLLHILKQPGSFSEEQEVLTQSFETILPERKNRERVNKAVLYLLKCLAEELWHLPELQPIYSLQFQRLTAEATRQQVELQKAQLMAISELNNGVRDALMQLTDAFIAHKMLSSGEIPGLPLTPQIYHNLPQPNYGEFIGREKELKQILQVLRPYPHSQSHLVTIDGIGGIGKSALALEVAFRYLRNFETLPPEERFTAIIWTSAKQSVLTPEGIKTRTQALRTLDDIYTTISITLEREDIRRANRNEQTEIVRNALIHQRTLLIVDNMETLDDEELITFLQELPAPTKAIVTTRQRIDVAYPIRLTGMPWVDAEHLILHECAKKGLSLSSDDAKKLFDRTGGIPLALVWSIAQMGFGYEVGVVLSRLGEPTSDIARFCFESAVKSLKNQPAYRLLLTLSLFATDANREAVGQIASLSVLDRDEGLILLEKLSLINRYSGRFSLLPLTKSYVSSEFLSYPDKEILNKRFFNYYHELLTSLASSHTLIAAKGEYLMPERENLLALIKYCQVNDPQGAIELISIFAYFLHYFGYWVDLLELCRYSLNQIGYQNLNHRALFLSLIGRAQVFQRDYEHARSNLTEAISLYKDLGDIKAYVRTSMYLAYSLEILVSRSATREMLEEALHKARINNFSDLIALSQNTLASFDILGNNLVSARARLQEAISIFENIDKEKARGLAPAYRLLARVELEQLNYKEAEKLLLRSLEISKLTNFTLDLAYSHFKIGSFYKITSEFPKSYYHFTMALDLFHKMGMLEDCETTTGELSELDGYITK